MSETKVVQIMPAPGFRVWSAAFQNKTDEVEFQEVPVVGWALVSDGVVELMVQEYEGRGDLLSEMDGVNVFYRVFPFNGSPTEDDKAAMGKGARENWQWHQRRLQRQH
jgi:hypothetical protein